MHSSNSTWSRCHNHLELKKHKLCASFSHIHSKTSLLASSWTIVLVHIHNPSMCVGPIQHILQATKSLAFVSLNKRANSNTFSMIYQTYPHFMACDAMYIHSASDSVYMCVCVCVSDHIFIYPSPYIIWVVVNILQETMDQVVLHHVGKREREIMDQLPCTASC